MSAPQWAVICAIALLGSGGALWLTWIRLADALPRRRIVLIVLRALALGSLGIMIVHPVSQRLRVSQRRARVAVLTDCSASMSLSDAPGGVTRFDWMRATLGAAGPIGQSLSAAQTEWYAFATGTRPIRPPVTGQPNGDATDIDAALREALRGKKPDAVILVSDGRANRGPDAEATAAWLGQQRVPVYCVGVGSPEPPPDVWIAWIEAPRTVKAGSSCVVRVSVGARTLADEKANIRLNGPGVATGTRAVPLGGSARRSVEFAVRPPKPGLHRYQVALDPVEGERTSANNKRTFFVRVLPGGSKLLVVGGQTSVELKFFARAVAELRDSKVTLIARKARTGFAPLTGADAGATIPTGRALNAFDAVILQNVPLSVLTSEQVAALLHFVEERGGGLGILGGPNSFSAGGYGSSALAPALGVLLGAHQEYSPVPVKATPTSGAQDAGPFADIERHDDFPGWPNMPLLGGLNPVVGVRAGASVPLRTDKGAPLVVIQRYGKGRTLCVLTGGTYRWLLSRDATEASRKGHGVFWRTLITWLMTPPNPMPVALETDRDVYEVGDTARLVVHVTDGGFRPVSGAEVTVEAIGNNRSERVTLTEIAGAPGRYEGGFLIGQSGSLRLKANAVLRGSPLGSDTRKIAVLEPALELADPAQDVEFLRLIANASGGAYLPAENATKFPQIANVLPRPETRTVTIAWGRNSWMLALLIALLGLDWLLRRWWGVG